MSARRRIPPKVGCAGLLLVVAGLAIGGCAQNEGNTKPATTTSSAGSTQATGKMRFWNQTAQEIDELYMAPAGTQNWGPNQCLNDEDKTVEADERLTLKGITPGQYDVKFHDVKGRSCLVKDVAVKGGGPYAFAIEERELTPADCTQ